MADFHHRLLLMSDIDAMMRIHSEGFETGWSRTAFSDLLTQETNWGVGAFLHDMLCAFILCMNSGDDIEILTIVTQKSELRKGVSTQLLKHADSIIHNEKKPGRWLLEVAEDNFPAIRFYTSLGFENIGRRVGYYRKNDGSFVDAIVKSVPVGRLF